MQPEVAHVGLYGSDLEAQNIKYDTFMLPLKDVDRAILDGETEGRISCMHGHGVIYHHAINTNKLVVLVSTSPRVHESCRLIVEPHGV